MPHVCIYCQLEKTDEGFRRVEHVLPQSFGTFANNLTLRNIVCDSCNQYFGDNFELALARDTFEGQLRFTHKVRDPKNFRHLGQGSRIIIRIAAGDLAGAYVSREYSEDAGEVVVRLLPQVGFRMKASANYTYFLLDEIPERRELLEQGVDLNGSRAIQSFEAEEALLIEKLGEKGINFRRGGFIDLPDNSQEILCEIKGTIDQTIFRAAAKIAFNYLAFWEGAEFLGEPSFNALRRFIRYGEVPNYELVGVTSRPILASEARPLGHLVTIDWAQDGVSLVAQFSLFNWATYAISLAQCYSGRRRDVRRGHFFDVRSRKIIELVPGDRR